MTTTPQNLTPAAKRDLALIVSGQRPDLRYGPYLQLVEAGVISGPQDAYIVSAAVVTWERSR